MTESEAPLSASDGPVQQRPNEPYAAAPRHGRSGQKEGTMPTTEETPRLSLSCAPSAARPDTRPARSWLLQACTPATNASTCPTRSSPRRREYIEPALQVDYVPAGLRDAGRIAIAMHFPFTGEQLS